MSIQKQNKKNETRKGKNNISTSNLVCSLTIFLVSRLCVLNFYIFFLSSFFALFSQTLRLMPHTYLILRLFCIRNEFPEIQFSFQSFARSNIIAHKEIHCGSNQRQFSVMLRSSHVYSILFVARITKQKGSQSSAIDKFDKENSFNFSFFPSRFLHFRGATMANISWDDAISTENLN